MDTEVLIAGAGPTGLVLAIWLARLGVHVRVIDKASAPGTTSRALAVQVRTLELYRQLELAQPIIDAGLKMGAINLWAKGKHVGHATLDDLGSGETPFPFALIYPQDEHERFLISRLEELGVKVERDVELTWLEDVGDRVVARLSDHSACEATFVAGCDGAHSMVRESLGIDFPGGTYEHLFYVADVDAAGPLINHELHVSVDEADFLAMFPLKNSVRLIGTIRQDAAHKGDNIGWNDVSASILERLRVDVTAVNWFSTYRVHHRVANHFRKGNVFLLGDAAHIHSPVGGQGMNTGIGDSVNLGWKLAAVLRGRAPMKLLDSYESERIGFARKLVKTTDRVFEFMTREGRLARWIRLNVAPKVISAGLSTSSLTGQFIFHTVSQLGIEYRDGPLSLGAAGKVHAGDRLPWAPRAGGADNYTVLESLDWQVHVYGTASRPLEEACAQRELTLHQFGFNEEAERAGLTRDAVYLVRPDGYLAFADTYQSRERLERYLDQQGLRFVSRDELAQQTWYSGL